MFLYEFIVNAMPFMVAAHDAGYNTYFNSFSMKDAMESFLISKGIS